jgi:recombination protein RecR
VLPEQIQRLAQRFARLPGVGEKTAMRFCIFLLTADPAIARDLGQDLVSLHDKIDRCERCGHVAERVEGEPTHCAICRDHRRNHALLCVVARVQDLLAIERSSAMRGRYLVLGKLLSPLEGVGPSDLPTDQLRRRIQEDGVQEVLLATPPSVDGEATALYLAQEIADLDVRVTRLASGIPHGGELEFADQITLGRAIDHRRGVDPETPNRR